MDTKQCAECGVDFEPRHWRQKYCSDRCRVDRDNRARNDKYHADPEPYRAKVREAYYANRDAKLEYQRAYYAEHADERKAYERRRQSQDRVLEVRRRRYADNRHKVLAYMRRYYVENIDKVDARRSARYAIERGALRTADRFTRRSVFERDGWVCSICGLPVDQTLRCHTMSASLDHIVPLTRGGTHTLDNVTLAHGYCNTAKGNRELTPARRERIRQGAIERLAQAHTPGH